MTDERDKNLRQWRVDRVDNFNRESVAEKTLLGGLTHDQATRICDVLCEDTTDTGQDWFVVRHETDRLWRGMEELI